MHTNHDVEDSHHLLTRLNALFEPPDDLLWMVVDNEAWQRAIVKLKSERNQ